MFEKILVPLDGSKVAEQVFPWVIELALAFNAEVVTLGVCEPKEKEHEAVCLEYVSQQAQQLENRIRLETCIDKKDMAVFKSAVLIGKPADEIISYAENKNIKLVVMASSGRSGIRPWSLGSTVDKLIREVHVPLLVVRATEKSSGKGKLEMFRRVLVPLNGAEANETVLPYILELISRLKSEVTLIQILATGQHVHTVGGLDYIPYTEYDINSKKATALDYLEKVSLRLGGMQVINKLDIRMGDPANEIVRYAEKSKTQLIAMSTHGHSGIERWVLGSVAYKVLQSSKTSVLLIPWLGEESER